MYKTKVSLYNTDETINRRIVIKTIENTIKFLGLSKDIYYTLDDLEFIDREKNKLGKMESYSSPRSEHIKVDFETEISSDYDVSLRMLRPNTIPIYVDNDVNVKAISINANTKFTVSFEYINKSKSKVSNLVNRLKLLPSSEGQYIVNHFDYFYLLPYYVFMLVKNVNDIKNSVLGTDLDIETYINEHFDNRVDTINPIDGDSLKIDVILREVQKNVIGKITTNLADIKKEQIEDESAWSIKFDIEFDVEIPTEIIIQYPMTIYNKLIDERFRTFIKNDVYDFKGNDLLGDGAIRDIGIRDEFNKLINSVDKPYITIPKEDNIVLPNPKPFLVRVFSVMAMVDPNDLTNLFNLNDIPIISLNQSVLEALKESEYPYIGDIYKSLFYFELYKNNKLNDANKIIMDNELNLRTTLPMDSKYTYRVAFHVLVDFNILSKVNRDRITEQVKSKIIDANENTFIKYYADIANIPESELLVNKKDIVIKPNLSNNDWNNPRTVQVHTIRTNLLLPKV